VAGIISEPIQAEGGDNYGTPAFFQGLKEITKKVRLPQPKITESNLELREISVLYCNIQVHLVTCH